MRRVALVVALLLGLTGCGGFAGLSSLPLPGGPNLGAHPKRIVVEADDVLNLSRQASVKVNDVTVGQVSEIRRDGWRARVTLTVRGDVHLPANAVAEIKQTGLLGEKYVALAPPTGVIAVGSLANGAVIGPDRTSRSLEVEEVLGALSLLLNGGGIDRIRTITIELNHALAGREQDFRGLLDQLNQFTGTLAANRDSIVAAIDGLDKVSRAAEAGHQTIAQALDTIPAALGVLADQRRELVTMLEATSRFSDVATRTVEASRSALLDNLQQLGPILDQLANSADDLPGGLQYLATFPFPTNALSALKGDYFNFDLEARVSEIGLAKLLGLQGPTNPVTGGPTGGSGGLLGGILGGTTSPPPGGGGLLGGVLNGVGGLLGGSSGSSSSSGTSGNNGLLGGLLPLLRRQP